MSNKDYSLTSLNKFLDYASEKGLIKRATADARKRAANKILEVLEEHELSDLREIDIDRTFSMFENLKGKEYKPESLLVFKSRLKSALTDFESYIDSPSQFKPSSAQRQRKSSKTSQGEQKVPGALMSKPTRAIDVSDNIDETLPSNEEPRHIVIPIPLRQGLTIKIHNIPADLTTMEAEKLAAIIKAYALPEG